MHFSILIDYPWYFFLFCLLLGAGISYLSYSKNSINDDGKNYGWPVWLLMALRFLSVSILSFLLLAPVVKSLFKKVEKPIVVLAIDNSQSILLSKDSAYYKKQFAQDVEKLREQLSNKYDLRSYTFGGRLNEKPTPDWKEKQTNLSNAYDEIYNRFYNQNVGAIITLTDGIYNEGQNPIYSVQRFSAPIYTVAMGDTTPPRDLLIKNVRNNDIVYSGNTFPLQIQIRGKGYKNKEALLTISNHESIVYRETIKIDNDRFYKEIEAKIDAKTSGLQRYHIELSHMGNEASYVNNQYDVFIDVLNSKKKILIVAQSPHPDISALKKSIERNQFYEVDEFKYDEFQKNGGANANKLKNYQLVILHQLPGNLQNASQLISLLKENEIPVWYIIGNQSALGILNTLDIGLQIQSGGMRANEVTGSINPGFTLFTSTDDLTKNLPLWPPLYCPFGEYKVSDKQNIFLYQQIGKVRSDMPLLLFSKSSKQKVGILCGEGIWKWFIFDFSTNQNFKASDEIVNKTIQYLSVKTDNRLFRVRPSRNLFYDDDRITFEGEVYNESYEPVKDAIISMKVKNEAGKSFDFTFQPRGTTYYLDAGFMPAGVYTYQAQTTISKKNYTLNGEFIVKAIDLEYLETQANHQLLNSIARQQGGKLIYPRQLLQLPGMLEKREDIHSIGYMQSDLKELIHFKWVFFFVLILLAAEWFLRKFYGTY